MPERPALVESSLVNPAATPVAASNFDLEVTWQSLSIAGHEPAATRLRAITADGLSLILARRLEPGHLLTVSLGDTPQTHPSTLLVRVLNVHEEKGSGWIHDCGFVGHLDTREMSTAFRVKLAKPTGRERRLLLRYPLGLEAAGRAITAAAREPWQGKIFDVSVGGIGVVLGNRYEPGTLLSVAPRTLSQIVRSVLMARVIHARRHSDGSWIHGCSFSTRLGEEELKALLQAAAAEQQTQTSSTERVAALKLALAAQLERSAVEEARATVAELMSLRPADPDAVAAQSFLEAPKAVATSRVFQGHASSVNAVAFLASGRYALSGSGLDDIALHDEDHTVRLWDLETGYEVDRLLGHTNPLTSVVVPARGGRAATASRCGLIILWDVERRAVLRRFESKASVSCLAFSSNARWLLSGGADRLVHLWDTAFGRCTHSFAGHGNTVTCVSFLPGDRWAVSGDFEGDLILWNLEMRQQFHRLPTAKGVTSVACTPDGLRLASGGLDHSVRLWDVAKRRELRRFEGHANIVNSVAFSPSGRYLLSGSADNTLRVWDVDKGTEIYCLRGHTEAVKSVAFAADGRHALSGSADHSVRLWELPLDA